MSLRLHQKHGANPTCGVCFFCGEDDGTVALLGAAYTKEAPPRMILGYEPCDSCKGEMARGIAFIECSDTPSRDKQAQINGKSESRPAFPTGRWCVMTEAAVKRIFNEDLSADMLRTRKAFIEPEASEAIGLFKTDT